MQCGEVGRVNRHVRQAGTAGCAVALTWLAPAHPGPHSAPQRSCEPAPNNVMMCVDGSFMLSLRHHHLLARLRYVGDCTTEAAPIQTKLEPTGARRNKGQASALISRGTVARPSLWLTRPSPVRRIAVEPLGTD